MTNSDNKNNLRVYSAEKFVETPVFQKHLVITYSDLILTNIKNIISEAEISNSELKKRIKESYHLINYVKIWFKNYGSTGDSDVLILLMLVLANILDKFQCELICQFGIGVNLRYYKVNDYVHP